jgi:uncharacterized protein YjbJ (UPF0337 family)
MNWDQAAGNWKQLSGKIKARWGKLSEDHLAQIDGRKDELIGKIQEIYGATKDEAERQIDDWVRGASEFDSDDDGVREHDGAGRQQAREWARRSRRGIEGGMDAVCEQVQAQPLTSLALAVGAGVILGFLLGKR